MFVSIFKKDLEIQKKSFCTTDLDNLTLTNMVNIFMRVSETFPDKFILCSTNFENQCPCVIFSAVENTAMIAHGMSMLPRVVGPYHDIPWDSPFWAC